MTAAPVEQDREQFREQVREQFREQVRGILPVALSGSVSRIVGLTVSVIGFPAPLGAICAIGRESGTPIQGEVVGFREEETLILPYGDLAGIRRGNVVTLVQSAPGIR